MKKESGYDKVWQAGCRECNYLNFGCGEHKPKNKSKEKVVSILKDSLKAVQTTYEFSLDQMKMLIALDLGVASDKVSVDYVIEEVGADPMDRYRGTDKVTKIRVIVK